MITNERQYKITKSQLNFLKQAVAKFNFNEKAKQIGSEILATAELEALKSEMEVLENQVQEYEKLKSGVGFTFVASNLAELPRILIQARIAQNLSQKDLAARLIVKEQQIQRYEAEEYQGASLKRLLEVATALNLNVSGIAEINAVNNHTQSTGKEKFDWEKFPFKEMYRRGWFEGFSESLETAYQYGSELVANFFKQASKNPAPALHRKHVRTNSQIDEYALLAWEARVLNLAGKVVTDSFSKEIINPEFISNLIKLSRLLDGPRRAKEMLEKAGIVLIIEPALPNTYLDGAALLNKSKPVIGLTLRHDRLDNFWFVLLHELYHVIKHLGKNGIDSIFDDLDITNTEKLEREADDLAGEALIPTAEWDLSLARFTRSPKSMEDFADKLGIHPAIIAGRIRHESNNYLILGELIGQGEVRKQFPEVVFGK